MPPSNDGDRLELVERDGHALLAGLGDSGRQREHFGGDAGGVARRPDGGEAERELGACPVGSASKRSSGWIAPSSSDGPAPEPADRRVGGDERLRVGLEEADVGARRGDRDLDGEDLLPRQAAHHVADQRRLAVAARRDQEHLLAGGQVAAEPLALVLAVGERRRGDDLAVDERVVRPRITLLT